MKLKIKSHYEKCPFCNGKGRRLVEVIKTEEVIMDKKKPKGGCK
jgi:hypothetical protein